MAAFKVYTTEDGIIVESIAVLNLVVILATHADIFLAFPFSRSRSEEGEPINAWKY